MSPDTGENSQLAGVVVCITGDPTFDEDENKHIREQFIDENVSRWLKYRSGQLVEEVTNATTHLICSRAAYRVRNDKIKAAKKFGCHIVTYEWLTDTLQLLDYGHKKKAPTELYHPGKVRDGEAISSLFRKSEKKTKPVKKQPITAAVSTAASGEEDARAAEEAAKAGSGQSATSGDKNSQKSSEGQNPPKPSESGEGKGTKAVHDIKGLSNPANESHKPPEKPKDGAKVKEQEPRVDLSLYTIYKDESGSHQVEVWKEGCRLILELYESKSAPKTYLFGTREYTKPGSSTCDRRFPIKARRDKEHELGRFKSRFWRYTGVRWHQRDSFPSTGPYHYRRRAVPGKTTGSASHKNKSDEVGKGQKENPTKSLAAPHRHRQVDLKTAFKRKSSSLGKQPAKELKVTKHSVAGGSGKVTSGGSKTA